MKEERRQREIVIFGCPRATFRDTLQLVWPLGFQCPTKNKRTKRQWNHPPTNANGPGGGGEFGFAWSCSSASSWLAARTQVFFDPFIRSIHHKPAPRETSRYFRLILRPFQRESATNSMRAATSATAFVHARRAIKSSVENAATAECMGRGRPWVQEPA